MNSLAELHQGSSTLMHAFDPTGVHELRSGGSDDSATLRDFNLDKTIQDVLKQCVLISPLPSITLIPDRRRDDAHVKTRQLVSAFAT